MRPVIYPKSNVIGRVQRSGLRGHRDLEKQHQCGDQKSVADHRIHCTPFQDLQARRLTVSLKTSLSHEELQYGIKFERSSSDSKLAEMTVLTRRTGFCGHLHR